jgi:hypothetical protein
MGYCKNIYSILLGSLILFAITLPLSDCTSPIPIDGPDGEWRFFATGFVQERTFWLCGNEGYMLEHCNCQSCPDVENELIPIIFDKDASGYIGKYVGVEGSLQEDSLGFCPTIVVESMKEIPIRYRCGDVNHDFVIDSIDAVIIANYVFADGQIPAGLEYADTNCSGDINVSDVIMISNYLDNHRSLPCDLNRDGIPDCGPHSP